MSTLLVLALQLGIFSEVRAPAEGYACLDVRYRHVVYKATRVERSRLTGRVTLTLPAPFDPAAAILGKPNRGRVVELGGAEVVSDAASCQCLGIAVIQKVCVDQ